MRIGIFFRMTCAQDLRVSFTPDYTCTCTNLFHHEWMDDLAAIVGQLRRLFRADDRYKARRGHFSWIRGEYAVDLLPDLQLRRLQANSEQSRQEVRVPAADLTEQRARNRTEEAFGNPLRGHRTGTGTDVPVTTGTRGPHSRTRSPTATASLS